MRFSTRTATTAVVCLLGLFHAPALKAAPATFKIAYWNIKSAKGAVALAGHPATFADTSNCTDPALPLNAWGIGLVQQELVAKIKNDPSVVALGLGEAWACGSDKNVLAALGWPARSDNRNGVAIVARYGFAGPAVWTQLDTSLAANPNDTMWVVRTPVCLDAACSAAITVFTAHWGGGGREYEIQARQTADFMAQLPPGEPHLMVGDLNVWEGTGTVCNQSPQNTALGAIRNAGYLDTWLTVNGSAEGYTGMANRAGCGVPMGYTWKRIDYAWYKNLAPVSMRRFGMRTPGDGSPSDHYGIIAEYAWPASTVDVTPPTASIVAPKANATVAGTVGVDVAAADDRALARVDLLVDGVVAGHAATSPYAVAWNTTTVTNGAHNLRARAYDLAGNSKDSALVTVTVDNAPPKPADVVLLDDRFNLLDRSIWPTGPFTSAPDTSIPVTVSSGILQTGPMKSLTGSHYNGISTGAYDLTNGGHGRVQLVQAPNTSTAAYAMFAAGVDGDNFYRFYECDGFLVAEKKLAGVKTALARVPYDATIQFLRIRYDAVLHDVLYETAPSVAGVPGTFTVLYRERWDDRVAPGAVRFELKGGTSSQVVSPGAASWDNLQIVRSGN
jgi:exonuclease III